MDDDAPGRLMPPPMKKYGLILPKSSTPEPPAPAPEPAPTDANSSSSASSHSSSLSEASSTAASASAAASSSNSPKLPEVPYTPPFWSFAPKHPFKLDVLKDGVIHETIDISKKPFYVVGTLAHHALHAFVDAHTRIGRLPTCDIQLEHEVHLLICLHTPLLTPTLWWFTLFLDSLALSAFLRSSSPLSLRSFFFCSLLPHCFFAVCVSVPRSDTTQRQR